MKWSLFRLGHRTPRHALSQLRRMHCPLQSCGRCRCTIVLTVSALTMLSLAVQLVPAHKGAKVLGALRQHYQPALQVGPVLTPSQLDDQVLEDALCVERQTVHGQRTSRADLPDHTNSVPAPAPPVKVTPKS